MSVYIVSYDLNTPGQDYDDLIDAIKSYGAYCKVQYSAWFIDTADSASAVRDNLKQHMDENDALFVGRLRQEWAGTKGMKCVDWLKSDKRTW